MILQNGRLQKIDYTQNGIVLTQFWGENMCECLSVDLWLTGVLLEMSAQALQVLCHSQSLRELWVISTDTHRGPLPFLHISLALCEFYDEVNMI